MRRTLLLVILLVLVGTAAGGIWSYYMWNRSDEMLRSTLLEKLDEIFPDWGITVTRARIDFQGRIHAYGLRINTGEHDDRLLDADEVILTIDGGRLADQTPLVRRIEVVRPRVWLTRNIDGEWNWQQLPPPHPNGPVLPEWNLDRLSVATKIARSDGNGYITTEFTEAQVNITAVGRKQYRVKCSAKSNLADEVRGEGQLHLDAKTWQLTGTLGRLQADDALIELATEFSPEFQAALGKGCKLIRDQLPQSPGLVDSPDSDASHRLVSQMGASIAADVEFEVKRPVNREPLQYSVAVQVLDGQVDRPPVEFPITDLRGSARFSNDQILIQDVTARSGNVSISLPRAEIQVVNDLRPAHFEVHLAQLPLDDRVVALLPATARKLYLESRPTGSVDFHATFETDGENPWDIGWTVNPLRCTARHIQFPYLIEEIGGEVVYKDRTIHVDLKGMAGLQPVTMKGATIHPGPDAESNYDLVSQGLTIDPKLYAAAPDGLKKVLDSLQLQGIVGGTVTLTRAAGKSQPVVISVDVGLKQGTANPRQFAYALTKISGRIRGAGKSWRFTNFKAVHDRTPVRGSGTYMLDENHDPQLRMTFAADDLHFDRSLYEALSDELRSQWYEINPEGSCHVDGTLVWTPGKGKPRIDLEAELLDTAVALRTFPYPIRNITGKVKVTPGRITISEFRGRHDETRMRSEVVITTAEDGEWRIRCEPLFVDDLDAGTAFRRALPTALRNVVNAFDLRGDISLSGMLELRGVRGGEYPVTAAWNLSTVYNGNTVTAGVELKEMHGKSQFTGTWDGEAVRANGNLSLNSVKVLGYQLQKVEGPIRIDDGQLVLGSKEVLENGSAVDIPDGERLTAQFIEGVLAVDALIRMGDKMSYDVRVGLRKGLLERFNQLYMSGSGRLAGVINGVLVLQGRGTDFRQLKGNGRIMIEPADLYDLPLLIAIFRVLSLQSADAAAFDRAQFDFNVRNGMVLFDRMNLQGESISLIGRGTVRMNDQRVKMDFYSAHGRRQVPIPLIREIANELTKGWVGIHIEGTLRDPKPETRPIPVLDDALKKLLGVFDNRMPPRK